MTKYALVDSLKLVEDKYLMTAGIDPKIRIWNIETEKVISKFQVHPYSTAFMVCHKEFFFSYGFDGRLAKFNFKAKELEAQTELEARVTAVKLLKTEDGTKSKLAVALISGEIILFDLGLVRLMRTLVKTAHEEII